MAGLTTMHQKRAAPTNRGGPLTLGQRWLTETDHVLCRIALVGLYDVELDLLALLERLEASALDGGVMDKAVLLAALGLDEAEAFLGIKPLNGSCGTHTKMGMCC